MVVREFFRAAALALAVSCAALAVPVPEARAGQDEEHDNFVYTSCTAVCPLLSQTFAEFQNRLGAEAGKLRMVSISIDPEQDTPERLAEYARRYKAGPQWTHYTGTLGASVMLQKAFQAYFGDKMHHRPVTFIRAAPGQPWVRLDGFVTPDDLDKEYRQLVRPG